MISREMCTYFGLVSADNKAWYITDIDNYLMEIDIYTGHTKVLTQMQNETGVSFSHRQLFYNNDKIYCLPYNSSDLVIYELKSKKYRKLRVPSTISSERSYCYITGCFLCENDIVMYGRDAYVVVFNTKSEIFSTYYLDEKLKNISKYKDMCFFRDGFEINGDYVIPMHKNGKAVVISPLDGKSRLIDISENITPNYITTKVYKGDIYSLVIHHNDICLNRINIETNQLDVLKEIHYSEEIQDGMFICGDILDRTWILLPGLQMTGLTIDLEEMKVEIVDYSDKLIGVQDGERIFFNVSKNNDKMISINEHLGRVFFITSSTIECLEMYMDMQMSDEFKELFWKRTLRGEILKELREANGLKGFMEFICEE